MKAQIMGILNITPDSFYDGGCYINLDEACERAHKMVQEGADMIDIGGESTRPFAQPVSVDEECDRILPVIDRLAKEIQVPLSVDTRRTEVMREAVKLGASIINDVQALQAPGAIEIVAKTQATVCLMHMQGDPQTMQFSPEYNNVILDVFTFLAERIKACEAGGIARKNIWIDPGFGFGKTLEHNLELLGKLAEFKKLGCPILVGLSRKSMFKALLDLSVKERLYASLAATILSVLQGAVIIRTHDVQPTRECLKVVEAISPYWSETPYVVGA